jgi:hypothetical protein
VPACNVFFSNSNEPLAPWQLALSLPFAALILLGDAVRLKVAEMVSIYADADAGSVMGACKPLLDGFANVRFGSILLIKSSGFRSGAIIETDQVRFRIDVVGNRRDANQNCAAKARNYFINSLSHKRPGLTTRGRLPAVMEIPYLG